MKVGACQLLKRSIELAQFLKTRKESERLERGGRKAHHMKLADTAETE